MTNIERALYEWNSGKYAKGHILFTLGTEDMKTFLNTIISKLIEDKLKLVTGTCEEQDTHLRIDNVPILSSLWMDVSSKWFWIRNPKLGISKTFNPLDDSLEPNVLCMPKGSQLIADYITELYQVFYAQEW